MSWRITTTERAAAEAWVLTLSRIDERDRVQHSISAISDLGNLPIVRCARHDDAETWTMTFSGAVQHLRGAPGEHDLYADFREVEVQ